MLHQVIKRRMLLLVQAKIEDLVVYQRISVDLDCSPLGGFPLYLLILLLSHHYGQALLQHDPLNEVLGEPLMRLAPHGVLVSQCLDQASDMLLPLLSLFPLLPRALLILDPFQEVVQLYDLLGQLKDFFVQMVRDASC